MHARRRSRRFRPAVLLSVLALAATAACGTTSTADPTSSTPATSSELSPLPATGPTVTVPGLDNSSAEASESAESSAPETTTTVVVPPSSEPAETSEPTKSSKASASPSSVSSPESEPTTDEAAGSGSGSGETDTADTSEESPDPTPAQTDAQTTPPPTKQDPPADTTKATPDGGGGGGSSMTRKVVVIDPGHNGQNGAHPEIIKQQVDAGFGEMKDCNTTGTQTNDGYTEALFNWKVSQHLKNALEARGITVVMTRDSNDGVGPCVNERAAIGNDNQADAVVSVHGDGDMNGGANGFYVMTSERDPAGAEMAAQSTRLATNVRDALAGAGLSPSNSIGSEGLFKRGDLSGLNLSLRPTVMLELGNMRGDVDANLMTSEEGQAKYAQAIALGVVQYLIGR